MLFGWKRNVQMIDRLARRNIRGFVNRAEQRETAIPQMVAGGLVIDEPDDLIPEFAMLENLVRNQPPKFTRPGNQHTLEADSGAPATFEHFPHHLA